MDSKKEGRQVGERLEMMHGERGRGRGVHMMGSCFSGCIRELCRCASTQLPNPPGALYVSSTFSLAAAAAAAAAAGGT